MLKDESFEFTLINNPFLKKKPQNAFNKFCEETNLNGWYYMSKENISNISRVFWACMILFSILLAGFTTYIYISEFLAADVIINIESVTRSLDKVVFPSIIICNQNKVRQSFLMDMGLNSSEMEILLNEFVYGSKRENSEEEEHFIETILASQKYEDLVQDLIDNHIQGDKDPNKFLTANSKVFDFTSTYTRWRNDNTPDKLKDLPLESQKMIKEKYFKTLLGQYKVGQMIPFFDWSGVQIFYNGAADFGTDAGACEWISPLVFREKPWGDDFGYVKEGAFPGEENGLKILLDAEVFDNGPSKSLVEGFKIAIIHHEDLAIMSQSGINIDIGTFTQLGVTARIVETTQKAKERFKPKDRGCFFDEEIKMADFNKDIGVRYGMANCLVQAGTDQIRARCACNTSDLHLLPHICRGEKLTCVNTVSSEMGKWTEVLDTLTNTTMRCIAACETTSYSDVTVGSSTFPNTGAFMFTEVSCVIAKKLVSTCSDNRRNSLEKFYPAICKNILWIKTNNAFCNDGRWNRSMLEMKRSDFDFSEFGYDLARYAKKNMAMVSVYMREPFADVLVVDEDTSVMDFISSIGGLLGLCMGFSFVTVGEICYFFCLGILSKIFRSKKDNVTPAKRIRRKLSNHPGNQANII